MYRQYFSAQQNRRRAFTLVELIIAVALAAAVTPPVAAALKNELIVALALFAIVAGSVLTFILFINKFGDESEKQADRTYALTAIRAETDYWFSYFDRSDFSVTVAADGEFSSVSVLGKDDCECVVPTTPEAEGRTGANGAPFPLAENLKYFVEEEGGHRQRMLP